MVCNLILKKEYENKNQQVKQLSSETSILDEHLTIHTV